MAILILDTQSDGTQNYEIRSKLGKSTYVLSFRWNPRSESWSITIADSDGVPLLTRRVSVNYPLLWRSVDSRLPYGEINAFDTSGRGVDPGLTEMGIGQRVQLIYTDAADL